ncbi:hypothetical protein AX17_007002 [Amanita inopinata Kibby_2008]|nr:hypothetical protein AX17_007002 [Amanita inopinata Kibby_2008]
MAASEMKRHEVSLQQWYTQQSGHVVLMIRTQSIKKTGLPRGKYSKACNTRCGGVRPVCLPCQDEGREGECSWSDGPAKKPRTEAHFEAMRKHVNALREYTNYLEYLVERCNREHGNLHGEEIRWFLRFRPLEDPELFGLEQTGDDDTDQAEDQDQSPTDDNITRDVCLPAQKLKFEAGNLFSYGNLAAFRFASEESTILQTSPIDTPDKTYSLMIDGAHIPNQDYDFDWSRHLPSIVPLERGEHDRILDLFFKFFTSWCLRIVPSLFLRDMYRSLSSPRHQAPPKTPHYSAMLHNALIAVASAFSDDPRIRDLKSRRYFAAEAQSYFEIECQKPNLSTMHALSILASFHSSQGDQSSGYMYFGMSARMSQMLGLGIDCTTWVKSGFISEPDQLDRNWAYWTTFSQDVCWSLYVGRDFCIPKPTNIKRIPVPFVDSDFDRIPWYHPSANIPPQPNYLSKTFAATCELLCIARRITDVIDGLNSARSRQAAINALISDIDLELNTWKSKLAPEVDISNKTIGTSTPHRLIMHMSFWWLQILLHRPFYRRRPRVIHSSDAEIDHVKLCDRAARNIMQLCETWRKLYTLRYCPITLVQILFSAGTVFLLKAVQAVSAGTRVAVDQLQRAYAEARTCVQYLYEIGVSWGCASKIGGILKDLVDLRLVPMVEKRGVSHVLQVNISELPGQQPAEFNDEVPENDDQPDLEMDQAEDLFSNYGNNDSPPISSSGDASSELDVGSPAFGNLESEETIASLSMEWSGIIAMLSGSTLPDAPFMPPPFYPAQGADMNFGDLSVDSIGNSFGGTGGAQGFDFLADFMNIGR